MTSVPRRKSTNHICGWKCENGQICGKQFTQKRGLTYHMRIHQDSRPFPCTMCDKKFRQKGHLTYHMRIHQDSRLTGQRLTARRQKCRISGSKEVPKANRPSLPDAAETPGELSGVKEHFHDNHTSDLKISGPENFPVCKQKEAVNTLQNNSGKKEI